MSLCATTGRGDPADASPATEIGILRAEITALRAAIAERDALTRQIEARNAALKLDLATFRGAVAFASKGALARGEYAESPSSSLCWADALRVATAARLMVDGASLVTVMPTGSMEPMFNERAILIMEHARFEDLRIGDVVTYRNPRFGLLVVHRILEKHGDKYWSKGDNNGRMDRVYITRENYGARVFGIIYAREPSAQARRFSESLVER
jgi:signal peptidase I